MSKDEVLRIIVGHAREVVPALQSRSIEASDCLRDLGANSTDRAEIVMLTLESCDLQMPLVETMAATNIGELASILHEKLRSG